MTRSILTRGVIVSRTVKPLSPVGDLYCVASSSNLGWDLRCVVPHPGFSCKCREAWSVLRLPKGYGYRGGWAVVTSRFLGYAACGALRIQLDERAMPPAAGCSPSS